MCGCGSNARCAPIGSQFTVEFSHPDVDGVDAVAERDDEEHHLPAHHIGNRWWLFPRHLLQLQGGGEGEDADHVDANQRQVQDEAKQEDHRGDAVEGDDDVEKARFGQVVRRSFGRPRRLVQKQWGRLVKAHHPESERAVM